jgi:hypothetical protein
MASNSDSAGRSSVGNGAGDLIEPRVLREYALVADGSVAWLCVVGGA